MHGLTGGRTDGKIDRRTGKADSHWQMKSDDSLKWKENDDNDDDLDGFLDDDDDGDDGKSFWCRERIEMS